MDERYFLIGYVITEDTKQTFGTFTFSTPKGEPIPNHDNLIKGIRKVNNASESAKTTLLSLSRMEEADYINYSKKD